VKNHTKATLIEAFECRLKNPVDVEMELALTEIAQIAKFRLLELVEE
jgi:2-oxo-4-hydroxy-4-carboxy-5-ureidoimidazoline decarboxylase